MEICLNGVFVMAEEIQVTEVTNLDASVKAYEIGDYRTALAAIRPLALKGNAKAQYYLDMMYMGGRGVIKSPKQGESWIAKSAAQGYGQAVAELNQIREAFAEVSWKVKGVHRTSSEVRANTVRQKVSAHLTVHQVKTPKNAKSVPVSWTQDDAYRYARERNLTDRVESASERRVVWVSSRNSLNTEFSYLKTRAESGDVLAQFHLGMMFIYSDEIEPDVRQGAFWLNKAAKAGVELAAINMANLYFTGNGVNLSEANGMKHLHTEAPGLRSQLSKVVYATADDELRPVMCGILMEIENNSLVYVASDGHILVRLIKKCQEDNGFISSFILPHDAVNALLKILPPTGYCELYFQNPVGSNKRPMCKAVINDTTSILFECIDGRYPNYKNVIPTDFTHSFTVDRRHLLKILDRISLFAPNSREIKIQMLADGNIELKSRNIDEDSMSAEKISYSVIHKTSSMCDRIYVNVKLLIKLLRNINGELVQFNLTDQNRAFTICPVPGSDVEDLTALLMPIYNDEDY